MEPSVLKIFTVNLGWLPTLMGTKQWLLFWFCIRRFLKIRLIGLNNFFHNCPRINAVASTLPWTSPAQRAMGSWLRSPRVLLPAGFSFHDVQIDQIQRDHFWSVSHNPLWVTFFMSQHTLQSYILDRFNTWTCLIRRS